MIEENTIVTAKKPHQQLTYTYRVSQKRVFDNGMVAIWECG